MEIRVTKIPINKGPDPHDIAGCPFCGAYMTQDQDLTLQAFVAGDDDEDGILQLVHAACVPVVQ